MCTSTFRDDPLPKHLTPTVQLAVGLSPKQPPNTFTTDILYLASIETVNYDPCLDTKSGIQ